MRKLLIFITLVTFLLVSPAKAGFDIVRPDKSLWVCVDYSVSFERNNTAWDCVTISENQYFKGVSHMVNYQVDGENLTIHDGMYGYDYTIYNYVDSGLFFHFWKDQEPIRNYKFLRANSP